MLLFVINVCLKKKKIMKVFFVFSTLLISVSLFAQKSVEGEEKITPIAFQISQEPDVFENLSATYNKGLLDVCGNDIRKAHQEWSSMLSEIEAFAKTQNFDINGVKMWLKVFWNTDGTIGHIAFHLKPSSKNIDRIKMQKFLEDFVATYGNNIESTFNYSLYSSASFPTLPQLINKVN